MVIKAATIVSGFRPGNSYARNRKIATRSNIENTKVAAGVAVVTVDNKGRSTWTCNG